MHPLPQSTPSRWALWLPRLATLAVFVLALGFLLHTSQKPVFFGKYNARYSSVLAFIFFVLIPSFYWLARFCSVTHEIRTSAGRRIVIRPRRKLATVLCALVGFYLLTEALTSHLVYRQVLGFNPNAFHPYLQNVPRPNDTDLHINRWGFRGDDIELNKRPDTFRVFVFGGSTVYCGTVPYEQTHCRVLESRLQAAYPQYRVEVQNLGAEWHTTEHDTIKLLFLGQDFAPDLVIMFHGINDLVRSLTPDMFGEGPYWPDYRHYHGAFSNLAAGGSKSSMLARAATGYWCSDLRFDQMRLDGPDGTGLKGMRTLFYPKTRAVEMTEWKSLPAFERNLRDFVLIGRAKGMHVLLGTQPSLYRDDLTPTEREVLGFQLSHYFDGQHLSLHSLVDGMSRFNDTTRRVATDGGVELVDLERLMPKTSTYLYDDVHYTKAGNELVGNAFADEIIRSDLVDRIMKSRSEESTPSPGGKSIPRLSRRTIAN
ncbi:MAG TPA: SGNH/GDSL hydrolase family protein [Pirellulales bacterium]|nr:SGNH/GDSL hydrolase family protein [Pirellulales bacterium]